MEGKIYIITHKKIRIPEIEKLNEYQIIQTGDKDAADLGYLNAATGENIADDNQYYADLTVHYWIWKNIKLDYVGVNHYSRFLYYKNQLIKNEDIEELLQEYDIIVPKKMHFNETVREQWNRWHAPKDIQLAERIIEELCPEYRESFQRVMGESEIYVFTIFIARKEVFNAYCEWIFPILKKAREQIVLQEYWDGAKRIGGYLSERLFNVWLQHSQWTTFEVEVKIVPKDLYDVK